MKSDVYAKVSFDEAEGDYTDREGHPIMVPTTTAECSRCGHSVTSWGDEEDSVTRSLATLRTTCPKKQFNWYKRSKRL